MTDQSLVSVILPTYNRARLLPRAINSVLSQSYEHFELIIIDDASTDNTGDIVRAYDDPRMHFVPLEQNVGAAAARNRGLEAARGTLVAFQDSDDVWRPGKLQCHVAALREHSDAIASVCSYNLTADGKRYRKQFTSEVIDGGECARRILMGTAVPLPILAIRRDAARAVSGFDEAMPRRQDVDLCLRLADAGRFHFSEDITVDMYVSEDSISTDPFKYVQATERLIATHRESFERHPQGLAFQMYNVAKHFAFTGHRQEALPYARKAVELNPQHQKAKILLFGLRTRTLPIMRMFSK